MADKKTKHLKFFGIGRIIPYLSNLRKLIAAMVFFGLTGSLTDIILPLFQRYALDHYVGLGVFDTVVLFVVLYLLTILVAAVSNYISCALAIIIEMRTNRELRQRGFDHLQTLSFSYFNQNPTGRLQSRVNTDAMRIRNFFINGVPQLIIHSLNFIGLSIFLFSINWQLTLIVFVPVPIIVLIFRKMLPKLWHSHSISWRRSSAMNTMMSDSFTGVRVVKAFSKEDYEIEKFQKENDAYRDVSFEEEAYAHENDINYLTYRKPFAWIQYIKLKSN